MKNRRDSRSLPLFLLIGMTAFASAAFAGEVTNRPVQADGLPGLRRLMDTPLRDTSIERGMTACGT